jgi:hypothetical protein
MGGFHRQKPILKLLPTGTCDLIGPVTPSANEVEEAAAFLQNESDYAGQTIVLLMTGANISVGSTSTSNDVTPGEGARY